MGRPLLLLAVMLGCPHFSIDQIAAAKVGRDTRLPSLELGCDRNSTDMHTSNISWRGPASPMGKETDPRAVYARLFGDPQGGRLFRERRYRA